MSNKKRKTRQQKIKYKQEKLVKIKELQKLRMEIIDLEKKIVTQKKIRKVRNLKICVSTLGRIVLPMALVAGVSLGVGQSINIGVPFKRDKLAIVKEINVDYETDKKFNITEKYVCWWGIFGSECNESEFQVYFPYEKTDSNESNQIIRTYKLTDKDKENIYDALLKNELKNVVEDLDNFKEKLNTIEEITETNKGYVVKCNLNIINEKDKLYIQSPKDVEEFIDIIYCLIFIGGSLLCINFKKFFAAIEKIGNKYKVIPLKEIKESLNEKNEKYLELKKGYNL